MRNQNHFWQNKKKDIVFITFVFALFLINKTAPIFNSVKYQDIFSLIALMLIIVPFISQYISSFKLPGGFSFEFVQLKRQVGNNTKILEDLMAYKPGAIAYWLLLNIKNKDEVVYDDRDEGKKRCLNFLLDDGYLQPAPGIDYIHFSPEYDGKKLYEIAVLTPIAEELINLRQILLSNGKA